MIASGESKLEIACPKCGAKPLIFKTDNLPEKMEDFDGQSCAACGSHLTGPDIESSMKKALDDFMKNRFKR
ncbi:ECs_2282 family putative zinc-binding protein [Pseudomonas syringae]|uniref:ECs_2282 family putative zinc-binding protein n=1 Tax=Pseudomonas syringae TaxID=317 RepID=UPI000EFFC3BF